MPRKASVVLKSVVFTDTDTVGVETEIEVGPWSDDESEEDEEACKIYPLSCFNVLESSSTSLDSVEYDTEPDTQYQTNTLDHSDHSDHSDNSDHSDHSTSSSSSFFTCTSFIPLQNEYAGTNLGLIRERLQAIQVTIESTFALSEARLRALHERPPMSDLSNVSEFLTRRTQ